MIFGDYLHSLSTMLQMMFQQASGFSSANHGLFHKYRIEALTLHGVPKYDAQIGFQDVGRYASLFNMAVRSTQVRPNDIWNRLNQVYRQN